MKLILNSLKPLVATLLMLCSGYVLSDAQVTGSFSREVAKGRRISGSAILYKNGLLDLKVSTKTSMAFYGMKGRVMVLFIDNQGRCIYMSDVFRCTTLCSTTDPKCKSSINDEPFNQQLPQSVGENTASIRFQYGDEMNFSNIRKTMGNIMNAYVEAKQIVGPLATDITKLVSTL